MTSALETIRYHAGMAGEEVADMVDELEAKVARYEQAEELRRTNGTIVEAELREQVYKLKAELKSIDGALNDPRANLTLTTSEIIWELKEQVEKLTKERDAEIARNKPLRAIISSLEETKSILLKKSAENKEAVTQLDSERQANAALTEELDARADELEKANA